MKIKVIFFLGILSILSLTTVPDRIALNYLNDALATSATAYVAARGINATISVVQDVEFSIGVMSGSPGELLDPLNDLIERFSTVMLVTIASLGIQKIMLKISAWIVIKALIAIVFLLLLILHVYYKDKLTVNAENNLSFFYKVLVFSLVLRLSVPFMAMASGFMETAFIDAEINANIAELQKVNESTEKLSKLEHQLNQPKQIASNAGNKILDQSVVGFLKDSAETLLNSASEVVEKLNPKEKIEAKIKAIRTQLSESISSTINLISLFVVQSVLLPMMFLYIIWVAGKRFFRYEALSS
ncbi:MAG: hypothetical protein KAT04_12480 [Methylococcales bacterium]|nr:hypothetical protein [Methylococcales bacterium]